MYYIKMWMLNYILFYIKRILFTAVVSRGQCWSEGWITSYCFRSRDNFYAAFACEYFPYVFFFPWRDRDIGFRPVLRTGTERRFSQSNVSPISPGLFMTSKSRVHGRSSRWVRPASAPKTATLTAVMSELTVSSAANCDRYRDQSLFVSFRTSCCWSCWKDVEVVSVFVMLSTSTNVPVDRWRP